jgi:hypothetical protein
VLLASVFRGIQVAPSKYKDPLNSSIKRGTSTTNIALIPAINKPFLEIPIFKASSCFLSAPLFSA